MQLRDDEDIINDDENWSVSDEYKVIKNEEPEKEK